MRFSALYANQQNKYNNRAFNFFMEEKNKVRKVHLKP